MENDYRPTEDTSALVFQSHKLKIENITKYIFLRQSVASRLSVFQKHYTPFLICLKLSELINIIFSMILIFILQKHLCLTRDPNENVPALYTTEKYGQGNFSTTPDLRTANIGFIVGTPFINIYRPDYICGMRFIFKTRVVSYNSVLVIN